MAYRLKVQFDELSICKRPVESGFAEPNHRTLATPVNRKPPPEALAFSLASHPDVDNRTVARSHLVGAWRHWCSTRLPAGPHHETFDGKIGVVPVRNHLNMMAEKLAQ
ncbi:hypothetical protein VD659_14910 [Herbiconiux sp. 11R-BC]|uniref:hypothetical protein n=1 Tax=Herbiconiux sp. 11R-BC TaxID=3111637 RepID=UPI003C07B5DF